VPGFVLFNLGSIAVERQDWPSALDYLRKSLSGSAPTDSITRKHFALIARCHSRAPGLGDLDGALAVCVEGLLGSLPNRFIRAACAG
jgi:hypothetical protein